MNGKRVSKDELINLMNQKYMSEVTVYRSNVIRWIKNFKSDTNNVLEDIIMKTQELFNVVKELNCNDDILKSKLERCSNEEEVECEMAVEGEQDRYQISPDDNIDTILGTKGETHISTLYLESKLVYNNGEDRSDISRILDYMLNKKNEVDNSDKEALMSAYVAMSRAERLTCIAIQYDTVKGKIRDLKEYGYKVLGCDDEVQKLIDIEN